MEYPNKLEVAVAIIPILDKRIRGDNNSLYSNSKDMALSDMSGNEFENKISNYISDYMLFDTYINPKGVNEETKKEINKTHQEKLESCVDAFYLRNVLKNL